MLKDIESHQVRVVQYFYAEHERDRRVGSERGGTAYH